MSATLVDDLRAEIAGGRVVVIVGAGVSVAASGGAPTASWAGLINDGVIYCETLRGPSLPAGWADRRRAQLDSRDTDELIGAAEDLTRRLGGPEGGEFARWLQSSVGSLKATNPAALEMLAALGAPIATTNYDGLLEAATGWPAVTWRQGALVEQVVRGDSKAILHLHGHWQDPASVVLGIRSYEAMLGDAHAEAMRKALAATRTLVFVGCGAGLTDPNFGALRRWLAGVFATSPYRHYRLCLQKELTELWDEHGLDERIVPVAYGDNYDDLASFLRDLAPPRTTARVASAKTRAASHLPPTPRCLGRDALVEELVTTLMSEPPPPTPVLGPGGIGKSSVCIAALHEPRVVERYGDRRFFVRCNAATTGDAVLTEIAATLGLPVGPELAATTLAYLGQAPSVLVLGNAETPWWADPEGTEGEEGIFATLAAVPGLALVVSLRGRQRPFGLAWRDAIYMPPLATSDARKVFLAVAGQGFDGDPHLDELVTAQDGLPLAITLLAYMAEGEPDLAELWRQWTQRRSVLLRRSSTGGQELTAEVSLDLSIDGRRMTDEARRLLFLLGVLPAGIAHSDLNTLLPGTGEQAATTLRRVGLAFDDQARLQVLQPIRDHVQAKHAPGPDDLARAVTHYRALAEMHGWQIDRYGEVITRNLVLGERGNLEVMISHPPDKGNPRPAIRAEITGGTPPSLGSRSPSVYDLFDASREALLNSMVAVGTGDDELIGWTHFLHEDKAERPTAIGTCYGLKVMRLLDAMDPRYRQHRVMETLWRLQVPGGGWSARTQSLVGRPEVTAWIISALMQAGGDEERISTAVHRCVELLDPKSDPVGWERTLVVATTLSVLGRMAAARPFSARLRESLLAGRIHDPEHGLRCWGELLPDGASEQRVGPSVSHTARAIIALGRTNYMDNGAHRAIDEAVRWLIAKHDLVNQTEHIRRKLPDFRNESLVVKHFTAAWVARALMSVDQKGLEGSGELLDEAIQVVLHRQQDGVWEWENKDNPIWMTYQGIATLRLHALRSIRVAG